MVTVNVPKKLVKFGYMIGQTDKQTHLLQYYAPKKVFFKTHFVSSCTTALAVGYHQSLACNHLLHMVQLLPLHHLPLH